MEVPDRGDQVAKVLVVVCEGLDELARRSLAHRIPIDAQEGVFGSDPAHHFVANVRVVAQGRQMHLAHALALAHVVHQIV